MIQIILVLGECIVETGFVNQDIKVVVEDMPEVDILLVAVQVLIAVIIGKIVLLVWSVILKLDNVFLELKEIKVIEEALLEATAVIPWGVQDELVKFKWQTLSVLSVLDYQLATVLTRGLLMQDVIGRGAKVNVFANGRMDFLQTICIYLVVVVLIFWMIIHYQVFIIAHRCV